MLVASPPFRRLRPLLPAAALCAAALCSMRGSAQSPAAPPPLQALSDQTQLAQDDPARFFDGVSPHLRLDPVAPEVALDTAAYRRSLPVETFEPHRTPQERIQPPAEPQPDSQKRLDAVADNAQNTAETYSVFSTMLSTAEFAGTLSVLGAVAGGLFAGLAAVGMIQGGYELYRKFRRGQ